MAYKSYFNLSFDISIEKKNIPDETSEVFSVAPPVHMADDNLFLANKTKIRVHCS